MRPQKLTVVGATGFEPAISHSQSERDTKLRHAPMNLLYPKSEADVNFQSAHQSEGINGPLTFDN